MTEPVPESVELSQFREAWRIEVRQRNNPNCQVAPTPRFQPEGVHTIHDAHPRQAPYVPTDEPVPVERPARRPAPKVALPHAHGPFADLPPRLQSALDTYASAVKLEEEGQIEGALNLYKHAFRIDSHVDRAYNNKERRAAAKQLLASPVALTDLVDTADKDDYKAASAVPDITPDAEASGLSSVLKKVVEAFSPPLSFEPEDERQPVFLDRIPEEIVILILMKLTVSSVEKFAVVNKKSRVLTLDPAIWRQLYNRRR